MAALLVYLMPTQNTLILLHKMTIVPEWVSLALHSNISYFQSTDKTFCDSLDNVLMQSSRNRYSLCLVYHFVDFNLEDFEIVQMQFDSSSRNCKRHLPNVSVFLKSEQVRTLYLPMNTCRGLWNDDTCDYNQICT